jgi:hypothetical protein
MIKRQDIDETQKRDNGFSGMITLSKETFAKSMKRQLEEIAHFDAEADQAGDSAARYQAGRRRSLCASLQNASINVQNLKSVFISYSGTGSDYFDLARGFFSKNKYEIKHGSVRAVLEGDYITKDIIQVIRGSACFLAIWTKTYEAKSLAYRGLNGNEVGPASGFAPSVWMPFELGVAMAFGKPFKVFVEGATMTDFLEKPNVGNAKVPFKPTDFEMQLEIALNHFNKRLGETQIVPRSSWNDEGER